MTLTTAAEPDLRASPRWRWTFLIAIAILLVSGILAVHYYIRFSVATSRIDRTYQVLSTIDQLLARLVDAETGTRGFLLTGRRDFLQPYEEASPSVATVASHLTMLVDENPAQQMRARQLMDLSRKRMDDLRVVVSDFRAARTDRALARISSGAGKRLMDGVRVVAADMKRAESSLLEQRAYQARLARSASLAFAIVSLLLAGALGSVAVAVDRGFERRRAAFEREMAARLFAERSVRSTTEELHRIESVNRTILDNSGDCIQVLEPDGRLVSMNRAGLRLMEIEDFTQLSMHPWLELWTQSSGPARDALAAATTSGEGRFQAFCPTAKGAPKWWDVIVTPILDDEGHVARLLAISRDISEQKAAEDERNQLLASERAARSEAEHATHMKDEFLATLSHELRTPLNSIVGWVGVLKQDQSRETLRKGLEVIDRNSRRQSQMIDDLLDVSRITSGKLPLDVRPVDLATVVDDVIMSAQPAADAKGVQLLKLFESPAIIQGDPTRLQQVVWNLVSNAIKFTGRDGTVRISLHRVDSHIHIEVCDTGQGIAPEFLPHMFQRFRQWDSSSTRMHGGLGLGLAIVKNLVEMHGGFVAVASEGLGRGAVFTAALPANGHVGPHAQTAEDGPARVEPVTAPSLDR